MGQIKMIQVGVGDLRAPNGTPLKAVKLYALEEDLAQVGLIPNTHAQESAASIDIANIFSNKFKNYKLAEAAAMRDVKAQKPTSVVLAKMTAEELDARFERRMKELTSTLIGK